MGSEMCIRDSYCCDPIDKVLSPGSGEAADRAVRRLQSVEVVDPCLLYTSDAADERSSVDLGGRRIIKKKKMIIQRGGRARKTQNSISKVDTR